MRRPALGRGFVGLCAAAAVLAASSWASASIPDAETEAFHGCVDRRSGNLRLIDPANGGACRSSEQPITWNARPADDRELEVVGDPDEAPLTLTALPFVVDGAEIPVPQEVPVVYFQPAGLVSWHEDESLSWPPIDATQEPPERVFAGTTGRVITIVADFTAEEPLVPGQPPLPTIEPMLDGLREKATPQLVFSQEPARPPTVLLQWGPPRVGTFLTGVITELHIVNTEMTTLGLVTEARVTLTIAEVAHLVPSG